MYSIATKRCSLQHTNESEKKTSFNLRTRTTTHSKNHKKTKTFKTSALNPSVNYGYLCIGCDAIGFGWHSIKMLSNYTVRVHSISSRSRSFLCLCVCASTLSLYVSSFSHWDRIDRLAHGTIVRVSFLHELYRHMIFDWIFNQLSVGKKSIYAPTKELKKTNRNTEHRTQQHKTLTGPKAINGKMENLNLKCGFPPLNTTNIEIVL